MKTRNQYLAVVAALTLVSYASPYAGTAVAAELKIVCPVEIPASSISITGTPEHWTADAAAPLRLHSAAPMGGPPAMRAYLVPDSTKDGKKISTSRYTLGQAPTDGNWIGCMYGPDNNVVLGQRLPDEIAACAVTYADRSRSSTDIAITCK